MKNNMAVVLIAFISVTRSIIPVGCKFIFIIGYNDVAILKPRQVIGAIQFGCLDVPCRVDYISERLSETIRIPRYSLDHRYNTMTRDIALKPIRMETMQEMNIVARVSDGWLIWDAFSLYPLSNDDAFFILTVPQDTRFALLFSRDDVEVRLSAMYPEGMVQYRRKVDSRKGYLWDDENATLSGSIIRSPKALAVYYGILTIKGSVLTTLKVGREFVLFRPDTYGSAIIFAPNCTTITWSDNLQKGEVNIRECVDSCTHAPTIELRHAWKTMLIRSTVGVMVVYQFSTLNTFMGGFPSSSMPLPVDEYKSDYIYRPPFDVEKSDSGRTIHMLCFIGRKEDLHRITVNGGDIWTFLKKGKEFGFGNDSSFSLWSEIPNDGRVHFQTRRDSEMDESREPVKYSVIVYGYKSNVSTYITEIGGYDYNDEIKRPPGRNDAADRLDACDEMALDHITSLDNNNTRHQLPFVSKVVLIVAIVYPLVTLLVGYGIYSIWKLCSYAWRSEDTSQEKKSKHRYRQ